MDPVKDCLGRECGTWDECPQCFNTDGTPREVWNEDPRAAEAQRLRAYYDNHDTSEELAEALKDATTKGEAWRAATRWQEEQAHIAREAVSRARNVFLAAIAELADIPVGFAVMIDRVCSDSPWDVHLVDRRQPKDVCVFCSKDMRSEFAAR